MKVRYFYIIVFLCSILFLTFSAFNYKLDDNEKYTANKDIIKFSHSIHSQAVECDACHTNIAQSKSLKDDLYPDKQVCATCHDVENKDECSKCHYDNVYEKLKKKKTEFLFDHSYHISGFKMACSDCHKGLAEVNYSFESAELNPEMEDCNKCHNNEYASNACEKCHISTANLIPHSHQIGNFKRLHQFASKTSDENCAMCHDDNFCSVCHTTSTSKITELNNAKSFYAPYSGYTYIDGAKQQKLTRAHDLNYVYSHGVDAKSKSTECYTCHQKETFCAGCHNGENNSFLMTGAIPATHKKPGFVTIGVGSGGGEHALLAKRDIERCVSCHDFDGSDQTCVLCHVDNDGIKGTNPKTHINNYMKDVKGDWHDSEGSLCFTCHTSGISQKISGQGFCGYCHTKKN